MLFLLLFKVKRHTVLFLRKRFVTGVTPGLQIQWTALRSSVGSTPIRFRHFPSLCLFFL